MVFTRGRFVPPAVFGAIGFIECSGEPFVASSLGRDVSREMIIRRGNLISFGHTRSSPREDGEVTGLWVYIYGFHTSIVKRQTREVASTERLNHYYRNISKG